MRTNHIYIHDISGQAIVNFGNVGRICPMSATKETSSSVSANETNQSSNQSLFDATFSNNVQITRDRCMNSSL
ncbi:spore germination protein [Bacillus pumilus]|uniref:spore germination protein n=1 Tax=Bacillus pumilus TaxID=1408 RepID=UPI00249226F9|nr:spore germination protein [Bacillus pumilus]